ncbi:PREDICTED: uncharacterized protein LOC108775725 [Cyphomyrmex costatus]|uniref:uncharacterized protein LOC108775725 n=1 Tax=Cyphomyrmex costatus TaxID=456900 RepID=UPI00085239E1|nr:PREDICTED: uncharacterized protein LOC108775725 [Cyphomyrmex costatus]
MKLVRIAAYIFRFFNKLKQRIKPDQELQSANNKTLVITPDETDHAIKILLKIVQRLHFPKELDSLSRQQNLNKNSPIVRLNPFIDAAGILRVGGRLKLSHLPYNAKYPALLPGNHPFSRLIIIHEHEKHFHAGPHATLSAVRQNYWLIAARDVVRQITRKCIVCFRSSPKMASTLMGNLPESRITIPERPFENCGVDYAGPLYYKEGLRKTSKLLKCYIAIFVCFASTAVHIELATDLSTKAFLNVLKRFISRRGCPTIIHSDNGLNFKGAQRELNELAALFKNQESHQQIINYVSSKGIRWRFIPPRAPHHGGLWEAAVKGAKRHLYRVTREAHLRYEELETLVIQIEAILNSRPLTPVSSDVADLTPLTPGHFVIGAPLTSYPEPSLERIPITRLSRWQRVEQIRQHFWQRWSKEYLHYCQQRNKWTIKENPLHVGQMVLLREDSASPLSWPLARIVELHPGNDNIRINQAVHRLMQKKRRKERKQMYASSMYVQPTCTPPVYTMPGPVGYVPPTEYAATIPSAPYSSLAGYMPAPTGYVPAPTEYVPAPTGYVPALTGYVLAPTGYVPTPTGYVSASTGYVPAPTGYMPTPTYGYRL